jgi:DNA uptake protein ComE-like DNA-binding protein
VVDVLNYGTKRDLLQLGGIGNLRAATIIEYRNHHPSPFTQLLDLKDIGIPDSVIRSLATPT